MHEQGALRRQFERNREDFILAEIESGITFARLAVDARDAQRADRSVKNARKAYETAVRFLQERQLDDQEVHDKIAAGLASLKQHLLELGEKLPD